MRCPACRETIKDDARICRYCRSEISEEARRAARWPGCAAPVLGAVLFALFVAWCARPADRNAPPAAPSPAMHQAMLEAQGRIEQCRAVLKAATRARLLREAKALEVRVDDRIWSRLTETEKLGLLGASLCVYRSGHPPAESDTAYAYSVFTGKQLAHYQPQGFGLTIDAD